MEETLSWVLNLTLGEGLASLNKDKVSLILTSFFYVLWNNRNGKLFEGNFDVTRVVFY